MVTKYFIHYVLTKYVNKVPLPDGSFNCSNVVHQHGSGIFNLNCKLDSNAHLQQCEELIRGACAKDKDVVVTICNFFEYKPPYVRRAI